MPCRRSNPGPQRIRPRPTEGRAWIIPGTTAGVSAPSATDRAGKRHEDAHDRAGNARPTRGLRNDNARNLLQTDGYQWSRPARCGRPPARAQHADHGVNTDTAGAEDAVTRQEYRSGLSSGAHAQRLDPSVPDEWRQSRNSTWSPKKSTTSSRPARARNAGATTAPRRARPSKRSKATACDYSSPIACPKRPPCTGTASTCRTGSTASAA